jgi:hypothetical protein
MVLAPLTASPYVKRKENTFSKSCFVPPIYIVSSPLKSAEIARIFKPPS